MLLSFTVSTWLPSAVLTTWTPSTRCKRVQHVPMRVCVLAGCARDACARMRTVGVLRERERGVFGRAGTGKLASCHRHPECRNKHECDVMPKGSEVFVDSALAFAEARRRALAAWRVGRAVRRVR
eukprot:2538856-Pleurochrysis_carterae.AAC.1